MNSCRKITYSHPTSSRTKWFSTLLETVRIYMLHVSKAWKHLDTQKRTHTIPLINGMTSGRNISGHWSRHAFRDIPKAQYTFKSLLVHGILQFTMLITLRCALHRCSSRDIRRWKLWIWIKRQNRRMNKNIICQKNGRFTKKEALSDADPLPSSECTRFASNHRKPHTKAHTKKFTMNQLDACEWSFRRFTYGNLVTTSPSSKW